MAGVPGPLRGVCAAWLMRVRKRRPSKASVTPWLAAAAQARCARSAEPADARSSRSANADMARRVRVSEDKNGSLPGSIASKPKRVARGRSALSSAPGLRLHSPPPPPGRVAARPPAPPSPRAERLGNLGVPASRKSHRPAHARTALRIYSAVLRAGGGRAERAVSGAILSAVMRLRDLRSTWKRKPWKLNTWPVSGMARAS